MFTFKGLTRPLMALATMIALSIVSLPGFSSSPANANGAPTLGWIQWTRPASFPESATIPVSGGTYTYSEEALGELPLPNNTTVYVKFTGEVIAATGTGPSTDINSPSAFATTTPTVPNYWSSLCATCTTHFTSQSVPTLPINNDRIAVAGNQPGGGVAQQTLSFYSDSNRTTPVSVSNIVMLFRSLGQPALTGAWDFDNDFAILSSGIGGANAIGTLPTRTPISGGARLSGAEANGAIQFTGTFSSISWTVTAPEFFSVWNVGATSAEPLGTGATLAPNQTNVTGTVGTAITNVNMTPTGLGGTVTYSYTGNLPPGLTFNSATGAITGEPTTAGDYSIVVTATGDAYGSATTTVNFTIASTSTTTSTTAPPTTTVPSTTSTPVTSNNTKLPATGADVNIFLPLSVVLLLSGVYLVGIRRRIA